MNFSTQCVRMCFYSAKQFYHIGFVPNMRVKTQAHAGAQTDHKMASKAESYRCTILYNVKLIVKLSLIVKLRLYVLVFMPDFKIHHFITTGACQLPKCQIITTGSDLDVEKLFQLRTITCSLAKETQLSVGGSKSVVSIIIILGSVAFGPIRHTIVH